MKKTIIYSILFICTSCSSICIDDEMSSTEEYVKKEDIRMLITYGQSLSVGGLTYSKDNDFYNAISFQGGGSEYAYNVDINNKESVENYYGEDFINIIDCQNGIATPIASLYLSYIKSLNHLWDKDSIKYIFSAPGDVGKSIDYFVKDSYYYKRLLYSVTKAKEFADKRDAVFSVPVIYWIQGEDNTKIEEGSDNNSSYGYYLTLKNLFEDLNRDIKMITNQYEDVSFITYQQSPVLNVDYQELHYDYGGPYMAHLKLALEEDNVYMSGPMYQFEYSDIWHPVFRETIGIQAGLTMHRITGGGYKCFYVNHINYYQEADRWCLDLTFDVPCEPIRFYYPSDGCHNNNGKQPYCGFSLKDSTNNEILIEEPKIINSNTLRLICNKNPLNCKLSYATDGHFGGGNLCDSQKFYITINNRNFLIDNFCVAFQDYIIPYIGNVSFELEQNKSIIIPYHFKKGEIYIICFKSNDGAITASLLNDGETVQSITNPHLLYNNSVTFMCTHNANQIKVYSNNKGVISIEQ